MIREPRRLDFLLAACLCLILSGCASTSRVQFDNIERQPKPDDYPMEILDKADINRSYKVIGYVHSSRGYFNVDAHAIENLKKNARKLGGDALIDLEFLPRVDAGDLYQAKVIIWESH